MNLLSSIYGAAVRTRNELYDHGLLTQRRLRGPVVSVGNLSAGGSGKTPFVILLGEALREQGVKFDVLSRGYGRKSHGVLQVDANGSAEEFGDEPLLIARRIGCPVIVGESRLAAGQFAERQFGSQLHILDDGFQHRSLARDLDVVLLTEKDVHDQLLPTGRLREPLSSLARADEIILMGDDKAPAVAASKARRVKRDIVIDNPPKRAVVFCGIARPEALVEQLRRRGIAPAAQKFYYDHHRYSSTDIQELTRLRNQHGADGFITTEKDVVNLGKLISDLGQVTVARVAMQFDPADALDAMLRVIAGLRPAA